MGLKTYNTASLAAATPVNVVTGGSLGSSCSVNVCNHGTVEATIKICLSSVSATIQNAGLIESYKLPPGEAIERTGIIVESGYYVVVESDVTNVAAQGWGVDE